MLLECTIVDVSPEQDVILKEKPIWNLAKEKDILEYQDKLNELLHQIDFSNDMKLCNKCNVMCLIKGRITDFHDKLLMHVVLLLRVTSLMGANCGLKLFQVGTQEWILPEIPLYFGTTSGRNVKNLTVESSTI